MKKRFAVFISGNGTNLQAIIDAVNAGEITGELALVVSDNRKAFGLKRAEAAGIKTIVFRPQDYTNRQSVDRDIANFLHAEKIDFIVLAGYMRLLTPFFAKKYHNRIMNIHPSLLPAFKGMRGIKDAFTYGVKVAGVTIHFVNEKMDAGPIIAQEAIRVASHEHLENLEERIHKVEHRLYPQVVQMFIEGRLKVRGRKVEIVDKPQDKKEDLAGTDDAPAIPSPS